MSKGAKVGRKAALKGGLLAGKTATYAAKVVTGWGVAFRDFILRGSMVDLIVAVVVGETFLTFVQSTVADWFTPLMSAMWGATLSESTFSINGSVFHYGDWINQLLTFIFICFIMFFGVVVPAERLRNMVYGARFALKVCPFCFEEIYAPAVKCKHCHSEQPELPPEADGDGDVRRAKLGKAASSDKDGSGRHKQQDTSEHRSESSFVSMESVLAMQTKPLDRAGGSH